MRYDHFIGQVQHRAHLESRGAAGMATMATLQTLAERLTMEEARDLAAQLPQELASHLTIAPELHGQRFSLDDFFQHVASRESADLPDAVYHARVVMELLSEAVSRGEMRHVCNQLPEEIQSLINTGSRGEFKRG